jgi:solute carrier family 35 protein E1
MKEISFAWGGLNYALVSNLGSVLRNVFSKKRLNEYEHIDGINMYALISIISLCYLAPVAFFVEGSTWGAGWAAAATSMSGNFAFVKLLALGGVFYHLYNQVSYQALTGISPLTFSVGNTMKRVAVIVSSVLFFKNYVSPLNWVGTGLAVLGAYMYSNTKIKK